MMASAPDSQLPFRAVRSAIARVGRAARDRGPRLLARLALALVSVAVVLAVLEVATRKLSRIVPPLVCIDPVVGTTFLPGYSGQVFVPERGAEVHLRFNREGMRGEELTLEKKPGVRRVAVIGDSMIAGIATEEERTMVRRLEERLNTGPSADRWEIMNFGVSGSSTAQELVLYRERVRKYRPDVVVCAFCVANDLGDNCNQLTSSGPRIYFDVDDDGNLLQLPMAPGRRRLNAWLNQHSRFYVWQRHATQNAIEAVRWRARRAIREAGSGPPPFETGGEGIFCKQPSEKLEHAWLITEKLLAEMSREVRADGAEFVLAVLPTGWQLYNDIWARIENAGGRDAVDMWNPDVKLCEIGQRIGIHVVLMTERFWRAAPHRSRDIEEELLHYAGVGHFNDRGNDLAAKILAEDLERGRAQLAAADQDEE